MNEIRYFSMFSGVGGFELGLERANNNQLQSESGGSKKNLFSRRNKSSSKTFKCVGYSEIDKYSIQTYKTHFPRHKNYGDATKINPSELPDFDMLCGGFPCQSFSIAGKRRGFEDTRGTLFFDVARILKVKRPKIVFLENVKGLLNHNKGKTFRKIIQTLSELGYNVQWMVLNSKFFGVPQNRERVFIIGSLRGTSRPEILPFRQSNTEFNKEQLQVEAATQSVENLTNHRDWGRCAVLTPERANKRQNGRRFKEDGEPSFTLTGQDIHGVSDGMKIRRLTPKECERLQGFPDNWTKVIMDDGKIMSDTQRYKQMGNAVTVNVIEAIGKRIHIFK